MFGLPAIGLSTWLMIGGALLVGTNLITAFKVADYVRTGYENVNLKNEIRVVEKERRVEVLDKKTLAKELEKARTRWELQRKIDQAVNEVIEEREEQTKTTGTLWCELDNDELRLWNAENRGTLLDDDSHAQLGRKRKLSSGATASKNRPDGEPVEE